MLLPLAVFALSIDIQVHLTSRVTATSGAYGSSGVCTGAGANPSVYNFEIDGHPAKILNDLVIPWPIEGGLFVEDPEVLKRALRRRYEEESGVFLGNNILYIDINGEGVLVDTGVGPVAGFFGPGELFDLLQNEGISRDSIKHVMLTHGHPDHLGGIVEDMVGLEPAFPNAVVHISRAEYEYWTTNPVSPRSGLYAQLTVLL